MNDSHIRQMMVCQYRRSIFAKRHKEDFRQIVLMIDHEYRGRSLREKVNALGRAVYRAKFDYGDLDRYTSVSEAGAVHCCEYHPEKEAKKTVLVFGCKRVWACNACYLKLRKNTKRTKLRKEDRRRFEELLERIKDAETEDFVPKSYIHEKDYLSHVHGAER